MRCECRQTTELCGPCRGDLFLQLRGVAACRGERWADRVAASTEIRDPWPAFEGKARGIAIRWVADLTQDLELRELLATELAKWAAKRWWDRMAESA